MTGVITDSVDDILGKIHEAGHTLKAGFGVGYASSTLRPRDSYVASAGGYFKRGGRFMLSLVADIGCTIASHMKMIGLLVDDGPDENQQKFIAEKRAEFEKAKSAVITNWAALRASLTARHCVASAIPGPWL